MDWVCPAPRLNTAADFMKNTQKSKYFVYGVVATVVCVPLLLKAKETIKLTFQEGDVVW
jgi:hypothetical protein